MGIGAIAGADVVVTRDMNYCTASDEDAPSAGTAVNDFVGGRLCRGSHSNTQKRH